MEEIDRLRVLRDRSDLTQLWNRCCRWYLQRAAVKKLKEKRKKKRKKRLRRWRRFLVLVVKFFYGPFFCLVLGFFTMLLALCSLLCLQAQDARHHGWHGPQDSLELLRCSSWTRFCTCPLLCYVLCIGPDSAVLAVPQLQFIKVVGTPC